MSFFLRKLASIVYSFYMQHLPKTKLVWNARHDCHTLMPSHLEGQKSLLLLCQRWAFKNTSPLPHTAMFIVNVMITVRKGRWRHSAITYYCIVCHERLFGDRIHQDTSHSRVGRHFLTTLWTDPLHGLWPLLISRSRWPRRVRNAVKKKWWRGSHPANLTLQYRPSGSQWASEVICPSLGC